MAVAGLKSRFNLFQLPQPHPEAGYHSDHVSQAMKLIHMFPSFFSGDSISLCAGHGVFARDPILRSLVKLAATSCRYVVLLRGFHVHQY
jgi:hypothetical protein